MEMLQCDGCDFRAESYEDLKTHIQDVHTVFLQPADADGSGSLKDEDEEEAEYEDKDEKDYTPPKAGMSPNSADNSNQTPPKQTAENHMPFYQCKFCVRYFRSKSFLRNHTKKVHNVVEEDSDASISSQKAKQPGYTVIMQNDHSKVYSCQYCTYKSPRKARIMKHQLMYHNKVPAESAGDLSEYTETGEESDSAGGLMKGTFACEWCEYQTDQKDSWTDHVVKEHSDKVKIVSSIAELEGEASASSPKPDSPSASQSQTRLKITSTDVGEKKEPVENTSENTLEKTVQEISSFHYTQINAVAPNSTGSSILSKRFSSSDVSKSIVEMDADAVNEEDSHSSLEDDDEEELGDMDDPSYTGTLSADAKQLLTDEDNKLLETKGIPFRKYMNRFQCPFCSFLTMHRRSISRHIENIHLSGKTTVYKCDECQFICTSPLKLGTHKQSHISSDVDTMDLTSDSPDSHNDTAAEPVNGGSVSSKVNGKKLTSTPNDQQNPHRCTLCNFSTTTLKGLRVHQQHKHSYCDDLDPSAFESQLTDQQDSDVDASPIFLQKTQTSILGLATKKPLVTGKRARKSINDLPLDLSSVKKRTRIDEIASNLQSKISQSQQDMIINLDDMDDEDVGENQAGAEANSGNHDNKNPVFTYNTQQLNARESMTSQEGGRIGKRKSNPKSKPRNIPISMTLSDDSENISADPSDSAIQENADYPEEVGTARFYCKHCDYHNKSARSVSTHYQRMHPYIKFSFKYILDSEDQSAVFRCLECYIEYTNYNDLHQHYMEHHPEASNVLNFNQPNLVYMCRFCSYTSPNVRSLMPHYQRMHPTVKINNAMIFSSYVVEQSPKTGESQTLREILNSGPKILNSATSTPRSSSSPVPKTAPKTPEPNAEADLKESIGVVRSQRERAQMVQSSSVSSALIPAPPDPENTTSLRSLKCRHCTYTSPYIYALKKHLKKEHPTVKATAMTILHWAYQDGVLEAGYHCEWCIYSHAEPQGLLLHYQRRHPEHNVDYTYMASKLWAGPETTQQGGNMETKHYKCRDCAFEACTIWDITSHYQAVHPWAIKGDESVLLDIIKGNGSAENINQQVVKEQMSFECQPVEDDGALVIVTTPQESPHPPHPRLSLSNNTYQCTVCLSEYNSLHGLLTHYGKKHPGMKVKAADFAQEADINPSSVYKCRHCPYVNSRIHGVLTHYQKRHPLVKVTAEDFADDIEQIPDVNEGDDKCKTQRQGYGAYRCKMCTYTHGTLEKLKIHYEKYHNQSASEIFSASMTYFTPGKEREPVAECSGGNISSAAQVQEVGKLDLALSQLPVNKTEKHAMFKCQLCKYFCSTRKGIARHYRIKHNNVRAQPEGKNNVFKCALCPYTNPIRKGLAAHYQKRHDIDAYYTHCLAASKTLTETPIKVIAAPPPEAENTEMSEDLRLAVERRKCSLCPFQAFSRKSIVSHYIKRHPGVFPKKQHASKLGRYFTVIYAKEPEKVAVSEMAEDEKEVLEVQPEPEQDGEVDWLPFKCLKCFRLSFSTGELLSMHYSDHHSNDLKRDFVVSPGPGDEDSELYKCSHCELKFLTLPNLAKHLLNHNEEFQKRAMRQERRRQLLCKQKATEPETKPEKESTENKAPIGFRCNFCVEMHPTLRAICNHLRKHVQYGEVKEGHVKQEVSEVPLTLPSETLTNGDMEEEEAAEADGLEGPSPSMTVSPESVDVAAETLETERGAVGGRGAALVAAARAVVSEGELKQRLAAGGHPCAQCDRVFMSMQGLRSHERSHSAMAMFSREDKYNCQYCQFVSPFRHNLDRHVQSHHGHHKPFKCKLCPFKSAYVSRLKSHLHKAHTGEQHTYKCLSCPFSSMTISQLKEHSLMDHGEALTLPKLRAATQAAHGAPRPPRPASNTEQTPLDPDDPSYLETADVRQQLSHYQLASRSQKSSSSTPGSSTLADNRPDSILTCEFCEFSSGYMQSLRRHYRDRHGGKKLFKCKDCSFFTCYKNTFTTHVEAGHNNNAPENLPKDLRCPLCLYHTKHKSNMIDHIVLHREERVAPLEVSRSKLSRHLQGLVFRCHKCTFTCSSDQALQLHLQKHAEIKPYQCQLCYYDSSQRSQLEEHLRLEHKVIRNFELMGRVNLDQLDMIKEQGSSAEEEEAREIIEMVRGRKIAGEEEDEDEDMDMMENMEEEQREMDDDVMEGNIKRKRRMSWRTMKM
ncbi:Zinc finger protein 462 [Dissostichus eleginoides]|uniref:Zinc finger protein 462 n=1 Tax=Dissostichus eleginoides TaxID=100907 RepID=A0AAD9BL02_DISEL|nr:Zinc finger protein 462 [Dissostichus eleginoides]